MSTMTANRYDRDAEQLSLFERWRAIETPAMWFVLMNVLDAAMIYIMLRTPTLEGEPYAVESNPIAAFFFNRWGIHGMFAFKLASAVVVCAIAYIIAFRDVPASRRLLGFATALVLIVVVYSTWMAKGYILHAF